MSDFPDFPSGGYMLLRSATVPGCLLDKPAAELQRCDILIEAGKITAIAPAISAPLGAHVVDLDGGMVWPGFVDMHTHLDKGHTWPRASNADGTHTSAVKAVMEDRSANWSAEDVAARMDFALRCAYAHGTVAIRTHIDSLGNQLDISWPVFAEMRAKWAGKIDLQAVALVQLDAYGTDFVERMGDVVAEYGGYLGSSGALQPNARELIRRLFDIAVDRNLDLDLHVDESGDPKARTLEMIAEETIKRGWEGRVNCGHCCSLAIHAPDYAREVIAKVAAAGISIVSLPMVNLYLQGRNAGTPTWRGVTLLHELRAAGVKVSIASDNTRDPFYGFGDLDLAEVFRESVRIGHLDIPVGSWPAAITATPADVMKITAGTIAVGAPADLVLFRARDWSELLSRVRGARVVLRGGEVLAATLPDYRELDHLFAKPVAKGEAA